MVLDPGVIERRVVGDEVEHQLQAAVPEPVAEPGEGLVAAQGGMRRIAGDREPGARDILVAQVGQRRLELPPPFGVGPGDLLPGLAGPPDAQEPDPVETHLGQAVEFGVRDVIQGRRPAQLAGQFRQPDAGIDLVERRIVAALPSVLTLIGYVERTERHCRYQQVIAEGSRGDPVAPARPRPARPECPPATPFNNIIVTRAVRLRPPKGVRLS